MPDGLAPASSARSASISTWSQANMPFGLPHFAATVRRSKVSADCEATRRKLRFDLVREQPREAAIFQAMRHPVEAAVQLARLKKLIPEQETEQATPERVLRVENLIALAPHDTGNTRFGIAAPCVVNGDRPARAQQLGAKPCSAAVELASIEVAGEYELIVASRIVDHAA